MACPDVNVDASSIGLPVLEEAFNASVLLDSNLTESVVVVSDAPVQVPQSSPMCILDIPLNVDDVQASLGSMGVREFGEDSDADNQVFFSNFVPSLSF